MKYACFISHRCGKGRKQSLTLGFRKGLEEQLDFRARLSEVFLDLHHNKGGDKLQFKLAEALYQSYCMIVLYDPCYFDMHNQWCAREYYAMQKLEDIRIPQHTRSMGLIIPVVIRGKDKLPEEIKNRMGSKYCFEDASVPEDFDTPKSRKKFNGIAAAIEERMDAIGSLDCSDRGDFDLPSKTDQDFTDWLQTIVKPFGPPPFPI